MGFTPMKMNTINAPPSNNSPKIQGPASAAMDQKFKQDLKNLIKEFLIDLFWYPLLPIWYVWGIIIYWYSKILALFVCSRDHCAANPYFLSLTYFFTRTKRLSREIRNLREEREDGNLFAETIMDFKRSFTCISTKGVLFRDEEGNSDLFVDSRVAIPFWDYWPWEAPITDSAVFAELSPLYSSDFQEAYLRHRNSLGFYQMCRRFHTRVTEQVKLATERLSAESGLQENISSWAARQTTETSLALNFKSFSAKAGLFGSSLLSQTTFDGVVKVAIQFVLSVASIKVIEWFKKKQPIQPEGPIDSMQILESTLGFVRGARDYHVSYSESPLNEFIINAIGIAAVVGYNPQVSVGEMDIISEEWMSRCHTSVKLNFPLAILKASEFVLEVISTVTLGGDISVFVNGRGVMADAAQMHSYHQDALSGNLERKHNMTLQQYIQRIGVVRSNLKERLGKVYRVEYTLTAAQLAKIENLHAEMSALASNAGFREKPFTVLFYGKSSVGKTSSLPEFYSKTSQLGGFRAEPSNIAIVNESDRYDSSLTGESNIIQFDDICQSKDMKNLTETPHNRIVRYNNNAPCYAIKADVQEKGTIPIEPKILALTSNTPHLYASTYMTAPEALLKSRINQAVEMRPKDYCRGADGEMLWEKQKPGECPHEVAPITYKIVKGKVSVTVSKKFISYDVWLARTCLPDYVRFIKKQAEIRALFEATQNETLCHACYEYVSKCACGGHSKPKEEIKGKSDDVPEDEEETEAKLSEDEVQKRKDRALLTEPVVAMIKHHRAIGSAKKGTLPKYVEQAEEALQREWKRYEDSLAKNEESLVIEAESWFGVINYASLEERIASIMNLLTWASFCSHCLVFVNPFEDYASVLCTKVFWRLFAVHKLLIFLLAFFLSCGIFFVFLVEPIVAYVGIVILIRMLMLIAHKTKVALRVIVLEEINGARSRISYNLGESAEYARCLIMDNLYILPAFIPIVYMIRSMYQVSNSFQAEGNLVPTSKCQIAARNNEKCEWTTAPKVGVVSISGKINNATKDHVLAKIDRHLYTMSFHVKDKDKVRGSVGALRVCGNWIILPIHSYRTVDIAKKVDFICDGGTAGRNKIGRFLDARFARELGSDQIAVQVIGMDTTGDIRNLFPEKQFVLGSNDSFQAEIYRKRNGVALTPISVGCSYAKSRHALCSEVIGFRGELIDGRTETGDCGSPWIKVGNPRCILGLHNGSGAGPNNTRVGICATIYQSDLEFMQELIQVEGKEEEGIECAMMPMDNIDTNFYGQEYFDGYDVHEKAVVNYMTVDPLKGEPAIEVYGSVKHLRSTTKSHICRTDLSVELEKRGNPCKWGQPPINSTMNHEVAFTRAIHPLMPVDPAITRWAYRDYTGVLVERVKELEYFYKPLTIDEMFNGRKEQNFKPMNMRTSAGLGLAGTKEVHFDVVETLTSKSYIPKDYVLEALHAQDANLRNGIRNCPIAKTAIKDEPTKLSKQKARLFYVFPLTATALGRKYLGPIIAYLMADPILSESWFGVKTTTDEWGQCFDHVNQFKNGKTFNGDYVAYDQTISHQYILLVGSVFLRIAEAMGYGAGDLLALQTYMSDLANPVYAFSGTLVSFLGLMPSGNPGTIAVNSVANSLLHRCFYYQAYAERHFLPPPVGVFRKHCAIGFVGDDSLGGVSDEVPWFNMSSYQKWLASIGMGYTDADKSNKIPDYVDLKVATLCKRKFVPGADMVDAPIELDSIWKSIHMLHKVQPEELLVVGLNCSQALRELARHPPEVFEAGKALIVSSAEAIQMTRWIPHVGRTYAEWRQVLIHIYHNNMEDHDDTEDHLATPLFTIYE